MGRLEPENHLIERNGLLRENIKGQLKSKNYGSSGFI